MEGAAPEEQVAAAEGAIWGQRRQQQKMQQQQREQQLKKQHRKVKAAESVGWPPGGAVEVVGLKPVPKICSTWGIRVAVVGD